MAVHLLRRFSTRYVSLYIFLVGLIVRLLSLPSSNGDMRRYNLKWYDYFVEHGRFLSLGDEFANYTPPYLYLLSLATLSHSFIPKLVAIKLIPIAFDMINSALMYQVLKRCSGNRFDPMLGAAAFWVLPTVVLNSAFWGQADSIYTCFLLIGMLFLLQSHPTAAVIAFFVSFSIKAQAVFIFPLLGVLLLKRVISWRAFMLAPLVYFSLMLPSMLAGRPLGSVALVYLQQGQKYHRASMNAANLYFFVPQSGYKTALILGFPLAGLILLAWIIWYGCARYKITPQVLLITTLISVALVPFLLPKMHDRYFYPADVISFVTAFFIPEIWLVSVAFQIVSLLSYSPFLFHLNPRWMISIAAMLNLMTIVWLLRYQWKLLLRAESEYTKSTL